MSSSYKECMWIVLRFVESIEKESIFVHFEMGTEIESQKKRNRNGNALKLNGWMIGWMCVCVCERYGRGGKR